MTRTILITRAACCLCFLPAIICTAAARIWVQLRSLPTYIRCDVAEEIDGFRRLWSGDLS